MDKINYLKKKQNEAINPHVQYKLSSLFPMLDNCIRMGTIPFSILARHGFIAKTILLSLKQRGILTLEEVNHIMANVKTVAGELVDDMRSLQTGLLSNQDFMEKYGHLRPGTYDIMSRRYDQMTDFVGITNARPHFETIIEPFKLSNLQIQQIDSLLVEEGFEGFTTNRLLDYIHEATTAREYGKFVFTKTVSDILELKNICFN